MKPQPRHFIAAPFLAVAGFLVVDFFRNLEPLRHKGWVSICMTVLFSSVPFIVMVGTAVMALKQRWEEFVKTVAFLVLLGVFGLLAHQTNELNKAIEALDPSRTSFSIIGWGLCVTVAPFVVCIVAYKRLVPLILRRIARAQNNAPVAAAPLPNL